MLLGFTIIFCASYGGFFYFLLKEKQRSAQLAGKIEGSFSEMNSLRLDKEKLAEKNEILQKKNLDFEKENELLKQRQQQLASEREDWEKNKENLLKQLSGELIRKNLEQQNQLNLQQQESVKKITLDLFKNFENVTAKVMALGDEVKKSSDLTNLTRQALLTPGAAGRTAEITLENILKNSGLKEKENLAAVGDYVLQSHFGNFSEQQSEAKRPDAILFFPQNQIAIIDSKSSPHFLELELARQNGDTELEKNLLTKIKESFRRHLETLKKRDYAKFLFEEMHSKNSTDFKVMIVMFLQTEKMLEILNMVDETFVQKAFEAGVIVATPIGLINFLSQARVVIDRVRQEKNVENLKIEVRKLLDNVALIVRESDDVGKALNRAHTSYNKMIKSVNRATKIGQNIGELGIESKKFSDAKLLEETTEEISDA